MKKALLCALLLSLPIAAHAGYKTCGTAVVDYSTRTCTDGLIPFFYSGDPVSIAVNSSAFGNVTVGTTSAAKTVTVTNSSGFSLSLPTSASISNTAFAISSSTCGATLNAGASCSITVTFTPTAAGSATANLQVPTIASSTPYAVSLSGTGVSPTTTGTTTSPTSSTTTTTTPTQTTGTTTAHATKAVPTSCVSYVGGSRLVIPYLVVGATPMWAELTSTGSLLSYKVTDYGALTGTAACAADGVTFDGQNLNAARLYYNGDYYKVGMALSADADGTLNVQIVSGEKATTASPTPSPSATNYSSLLPGTWGLHYGVSTVTFRDDGTYYAPNGGTGTYSWSGDTLSVDGALTSGHAGTAFIEVTPSATWLSITWTSSYGTEMSALYYKMN